MRNIFFGITVFNSLVILGFVLFSFSAQPRIAFVDSAKLLNDYKGMHEARELYNAKVSVWEANIDTLSNDLKVAIQEYQTDGTGMTAKERGVTEELIASKRSRLSDYQQAIREQANREETELTKRVLDVVNLALKNYGEKHGYEVILATTEYGNIAFGSESLDITDQVLIELNNGFSSR